MASVIAVHAVGPAKVAETVYVLRHKLQHFGCGAKMQEGGGGEAYELHFIDVNSMNLNEEPDFDYYDIAIPTQKRGKGFNNLIDPLFIDFIGEYEELEYAFEKIDLNDREKYYI